MFFFEEFGIRQPDYHLGAGDVNSTLASSIVAKKMQIKVAHVEAGLRSFDLSMPEEINRMVTDSISDLFFITEEQGMANLIKEGKDRDKLHFVDHVMIDNLFYQLKRLETTALGVPCLTIRENTERSITVTQGTNELMGTSCR